MVVVVGFERSGAVSSFAWNAVTHASFQLLAARRPALPNMRRADLAGAGWVRSGESV